MPIDLDGMLYKLTSGMRSKRKEKVKAQTDKEDKARSKRFKKFQENRKKNPNYVKEQIEKRKKKLGLKADPYRPN
jgi:hypothetical protein